MSFPAIFTIKEFTGRHMLGVLFLFFGTIITVNMFLAWFAVGTWSGLVAKNGYVASIDYKKLEMADEKQRALGWSARIRVEAGHIIYRMKDANGKPLTGMNVTAVIGRPTTEKDDLKASFTSSRPGEYIATAPAAAGQWNIDIRATNAKNQIFIQKYRIKTKAVNKS